MFDHICAELKLGELTAAPLRLSGGYTHRIFRVETTLGTYAVKLLNPEIMQRPDALDNYRAAETFEALLEQNHLPILPALTIGESKLHCVNGQYLYVFDYFAGRALHEGEISLKHCAKIGNVLARIHGVESPGHPQATDNAPVKEIPWRELGDTLLSSADAHAEGELLQAAAPMLERVTAAAGDAARWLLPVTALCHNDMDPKNVLWRGDEFRIIDLECLGYADPRQEMLDLAISWSGGDERRFKAFVAAYYAAGGVRPADATLLYDSRRNDIDWLAYNAGRAMSGDPEERRTGREQVRMTLAKIEDDLCSREKVLRWMEEINMRP